MYSDVFCKVYNEFGWNYYPEVFGQQLLGFLEREEIFAGKSLDLACGTGDFSLEIALHSGNGTRVCGLDLSEGMLEVMRRKVAQSGLSERISVEQGNCEAMHFADGSFDRATIGFGTSRIGKLP